MTTTSKLFALSTAFSSPLVFNVIDFNSDAFMFWACFGAMSLFFIVGMIRWASGDPVEGNK